MIRFMTTLMAAVALTSCSVNNSPMKTDLEPDTMTQAEKEARVLTPEVMWKMGRLSSTVLSNDGSQVAFCVTRYNMEANKGMTSIWIMNADGSQMRRLTDENGSCSSPQFSTNGDRLYFLSTRSGSSQIWSIDLATSATKQLSNEDVDIEGFQVSPGDHSVWFTKQVKVDKVASSEYFPELQKSQARIYDDLMVRHWDRWEDGEYLHIFLATINPSGVGVAKDITAGEGWDCPTAPYHSHEEISWNKAGDALAYTSRKLRGYNYSISTNTDIYQFSLVDSTTANLSVPFPGYDKYPVYSANNQYLAWQSMERAGNEADKARLMLYDFDKLTKYEVTKNFDYNASSLQFDDESKNIYFIAPIEATHQVCKVEIATGNVTVLTKGEHDYNSIKLAGNTLVGERCDISHGTELFAIDKNSGEQTQLTNINQEIYENVDMGEVRKRWIKTTDGKDMLAWVILPPNFDATKKYPTLLYCQGGPQSTVSQFWSYRWNFQLMASQGYVVIAPNRRGLPSFGQEWLDQISGDYAGQCQRDLISAIDDIAKEPWVDNDRLGSVGASFGGFSVFYQAGNYADRFRAFIAHCGIYNFEAFYGATEELWFPNNDLGGPYWQKNNATAQRSYANSPHKFAQNWKRPILIITGELDYRIPYTQSLEAFTVARSLGLPSKLVSFKDEGHTILKPQNSIVWNKEFFSWLDKHLKNAYVAKK